MLRYCAWCGKYQGATPGEGYQIRKNVCEIDTATICSACLAVMASRRSVERLPKASENEF